MIRVLMLPLLVALFSCKKENTTIDPTPGRSQEEVLNDWIYYDSRYYAYQFLNEGDAHRVRDTMLFTYPIMGPVPDLVSFKKKVVDQKSQQAFKQVFWVWRDSPELWKGLWYVFAVTFIDGTTETTVRFTYEIKAPEFTLPRSGYWALGAPR